MTLTSLTGMTLADLLPLANHLWQSTGCTGAVWALTLALKKNRAAVRYWLWLTASVKFLVPFSLLVSLGSHLGWRTVVPVGAPQWSSMVEDIGHPFAVASSLPPVGMPTTMNFLPLMLFTGWFVGFAVSIVFWFRTWQQMRAVRRQATALALSLPIPVMSSSSRIEPGVYGVRNPVLLLPQGITNRLTADQFDAVLAHEMCHVQRRDNLTAAIHMVVEAVFWFYPLVWWIRVRLIEERERACDEAVLQSGSDAESYAEGILSVCKLYAEAPLACISGISGSDLKKRIVRIMTQPCARKLTLGRKILLAVIGTAAIVLPIEFGLLNAIPSRAQSPAQDANSTAHVYDVASIKPNKSGDNKVRVMSEPDGLTATGATLDLLIQNAYGVRYSQILGAPSWFRSERYDIEAKMDDSTAEELRKLTEGQRKVERDGMLQALLADRFQLRLHSDIEELPMYALVVAKNGPKLQQAKPGDTYPHGFRGPADRPAGGMGMMLMQLGGGQITGQGVPLADLVNQLSQQLGRTILDKTGLIGKYDFTLKWTPDESQGPPGPAGINNTPPTESSGPSIFTAIQEQLGLKLESQKGMAEILVIDHVERPSEN
jgi:bla regulator protein blaR1